MECFLTPITNSLWTPARCPRSRLNSNTNYLVLLSEFPGLRVQSHKTAPTSDAIAYPGLPILLTDQLWIGVPPNPSSVSLICSNRSQNSGKCFTYYYPFIFKETAQEQPHVRDAQGKVGHCGTWSFHASQGTSPSQDLDVFANLEAHPMFFCRA